MLRSLAVAALLFASVAPAQPITSYRTENPAPIKGDLNKIVCEKQETIGTRLGARKVCLTVGEWQDRRYGEREHTERIQTGTRVCANPPC